MNRVYIFLLGALDGAVYSAVMALLVWQLRAREFARDLEEEAATGQSPALSVANERWWSIILIWIIIFGFTAVVVDRFLTRNKRSVLFWEAVGLIAIAMWHAVVALPLWIENWFAHADTQDWNMISSSPLFGLISVGVVLIVSFVYALAVGFAQRLLKLDSRRVAGV